MKQTLVRYKTKLEAADENARLIGEVFKELKAKAPDGVRYMVLRLPDGGFIHFATFAEGASSASITGLDAFKVFQGGVKDRALEPPVQAEPVIVASYGFLA